MEKGSPLSQYSISKMGLFVEFGIVTIASAQAGPFAFLFPKKYQFPENSVFSQLPFNCPLGCGSVGGSVPSATRIGWKSLSRFVFVLERRTIFFWCPVVVWVVSV